MGRYSKIWGDAGRYRKIYGVPDMLEITSMRGAAAEAVGLVRGSGRVRVRVRVRVEMLG